MEWTGKTVIQLHPMELTNITFNPEKYVTDVSKNGPKAVPNKCPTVNKTIKEIKQTNQPNKSTKQILRVLAIALKWHSPARWYQFSMLACFFSASTTIFAIDNNFSSSKFLAKI